MKKIVFILTGLLILVSCASNAPKPNIEYTITWKNWDGSVLKIDKNVVEGTTPIYKGTTPTKESTAKYDYTFYGWDPDIVKAKADKTYTACFTESDRTYKITWEDEDGNVLKVTNEFYGSIPNYGGTPSKKYDDFNFYVFSGWEPDLESATGCKTYRATFEKRDRIDFYVTYNANGGALAPEQQTFNKNETITLAKSSPWRDGYKFFGWNNIYEDKIYQPGDEFKMDHDVTLWAVWEKLCENCNHTGMVKEKCSYCNGTGNLGCVVCGSRSRYLLPLTNSNGLYHKEVCYNCYKGSGLISTGYRNCSSCNGIGKNPYFTKCQVCDGLTYEKEEAPRVLGTYPRKIIIEAKNGYEYSFDGGPYQSNTVFTNLKPKSSHIIRQRRKTKDDIPFGCSSKPLTAYTSADTNYYITYELNGGTNNVNNPSTYNVKKEQIKLENPTKEGFYFDGWTYNGNKVSYISPEWDEDVVLVANWSLLHYTISYNFNLGGYYTGDFPRSHSILDDEIALLPPIRTGYTFLGWTGSNGNVPQTDVTIPAKTTGNLYYTANWKLETYSINYELNGGTISEGNATAYTINDSTISLLHDPTKENYDFNGWIVDGKLLNKSYDNGSKISYFHPYDYCKDITLVADWNPHEYSINYNLDGGISDNPLTHTIESTDIYLNKPTKNGYTFIGWTGSNGTEPSMSVTIKAGNVENLSYTANWSLNTYSIAYVLNGGENPSKNPNSYTTEDTLCLKDAFKDNYTFEGWYKEPEFINKVETLNGQYGDLTLYAKFLPISYNVKYDLKGGQVSKLSEATVYLHYNCDSLDDDVLKLSLGEKFNLFENIPTRNDGYAFAGWFYYDKNNKLEEVYNGYQLANSNSFYAKWDYVGKAIKIAKDLSFEPKPSGYLRRGTEAYVPYDSDCLFSCLVSGDADGYIEMNGIVYYHCLWRNYGEKERVHEFSAPHNNVMEFFSNSEKGGTCIKITSINKRDCYISYDCYNTLEKYDTIFSNIGVEQEGYDFAGWFDDEGTKAHEIWDYSEDKNFHAEWIPLNYFVTYNLNGGLNNSFNPSKFVCTDYIELLNPQKEGYTFDGWYSDSTFENKVTHINGSSCCDLVLYAKWKPINYIATLDYNDGENVPVLDFYSGDILLKSEALYKDKNFDYYIPVSENETKIFIGWFTDEELTKPFCYDGKINQDTKLYAKWVSKDQDYSSLGEDVNVTINGKNEGLIQIVSLIDQNINISSVSDLDLFGSLYDENMNLIVSSDDISDSNLNFGFNVDLKSGKTYYVGYKANQANISGEALICLGGENKPSTSLVGDYKDESNVIEVTYDDVVILPTLHKEGYEFIGWYDENGNLFNGIWNYSSNQTLTARWQQIN